MDDFKQTDIWKIFQHRWRLTNLNDVFLNVSALLSKQMSQFIYVF